LRLKANTVNRQLSGGLRARKISKHERQIIMRARAMVNLRASCLPDCGSFHNFFRKISAAFNDFLAAVVNNHGLAPRHFFSRARRAKPKRVCFGGGPIEEIFA
jgi:hypothetical protein